jgi:hypothetical protein
MFRVARFVTIVNMSMHVDSASSVPLPYGVRSVRELTDEMVEAGKAGNRGLILDQLLRIAAVCEQEEAEDPRYLEIHLRTVDRIMRLLKLLEPQKQDDGRQGDLDRRALVAAAARSLDELEARSKGA